MATTRLDPHPFLSPAEVGALLNVKPETVLGWTRTGRLRCVYTASGRRLYLKADLLALHPELMGLATTAVAEDLLPVAGPVRTEPDTDPLPGSTAGAVVVAEAVLIAAEADAELAREAVELATAEVLAAAQKVAAAAARAHESREFAAAVAAEAVALAAEHASEAERSRTAASAVRVSQAADEAARLVLAAAGSPHRVDEALRAAGELAALVRAAAVASAQEAESAAASRAATADDAATQLALLAQVTDRACVRDAEAAAADLEATTTRTRRRLAAGTKKHAEGTASRAHGVGAAILRSR